MFHTIAEVTSISFDLRRQIFAEAKKKKKKKRIRKAADATQNK